MFLWRQAGKKWGNKQRETKAFVGAFSKTKTTRARADHLARPKNGMKMTFSRCEANKHNQTRDTMIRANVGQETCTRGRE
jgi:hypothetical protein